MLSATQDVIESFRKNLLKSRKIKTAQTTLSKKYQAQ
jgi:hypothetical protein